MANEDTLNNQTEDAIVSPETTAPGNIVFLQAPEAGQTTTVTMNPGDVIRLDFDINNQTLVLAGDDLRIEFDNGAVIVLQDFADLADQGAAPLISMEDGSMVPGGVLLAALTEEPVEAAAGEAGATSGGSGEYRGDLGDILNGVDKLGGQDPDPFGGEVATTLEDEQTPLPEPEPVPEPVNNPPDAVNDNYVIQIDPENPTAAIEALQGILSNDADPDGDPITITNVGELPPNVSVNSNDGSITLENLVEAYKSLDEGEESQPLTFQYTISDPSGATDTATVSIVFIGVNDPPEATDNLNEITDGDELLYVEGDMIADDDGDGVDSDPDDIVPDEVPVTEVQFGENSETDGSIGLDGNYGKLTWNSDGTYRYTVDPEKAAGLDSDDSVEEVFTYTITDDNGASSQATLTITVNGINDAPVAVDNQYSVGEDNTLTGDNIVTDTGTDPDFTDPTADFDVDGDSLTVYEIDGSTTDVGQQVTLASGALLTVNADGTFSYDPNGQFEYLAKGETTTDSFTYKVSDGDAQSNLAKVTITIDGANDAPIVGNVSAVVSEEGLAGGNPDTIGNSTDSTNETTFDSSSPTYGTISISDADTNDTLTVTLADPTGDVSLTSNGETVTWALSGGDKVLTGSADGEEVVVITLLDDAGNYKVELKGPIDHETNDGENIEDFAVTVNVSDGTTTSTGTLTVYVEDDSPLDIAQNAVIGNEDGNALTANLVSYGGDGPAMTDPALVISTFDGTDEHDLVEGLFVYDNSGDILTAMDIELVYQLDADGNWIAVMDPSKATILVEETKGNKTVLVEQDNPNYDADHVAFSLAVNEEDGTYTVTIVDGLDGMSEDITISLADGKYSGGNEQEFVITGANGLVITATAYAIDEDGNRDDLATVNHNSFALGVSEGDKIEGDGDITGGPDDELADDFLVLEFSQDLQTLDLSIWHFDNGDTGTWEAFKGGSPVASGTFDYNDLTPTGGQFFDYTLDAGTDFDTLVFSGNTGKTGYGLSTITLRGETTGEDHTLTYTYTATDYDGDTITGDFDVTFDGAGNIQGSAESDAIIGTTEANSIFGNEGNDLLIGAGGNDILTGGDGADSFGYSATGGEGSDAITDFTTGFDPTSDVLRFYDVVDSNNDNIFDDLDVTVAVEVDDPVDGGNITLTINGSTTVTLEGANAGGDFTGDTSLGELMTNGLQVDFNPDTFAS